MGLLNKATVMISIPNPARDLDSVEDIWFRPGRYVRVDIKHPDSAIITKNLLSTGSLPNINKLKELYPNLKTQQDVTEFSNRILQMNAASFEGLVTSFDFSYLPSGQVDATISLTGTSNTYTDVSMYLPGAAEEKPPVPKKTTEVTIDPIIPTESKPPAPETITGKSSFFNLLYTKVDKLIIEATNESTPISTGCITWKSENVKTPVTDQYIVFGERYPSVNIFNGQHDIRSNSNFSRYITLGALIQFINDYPVQNITGSLPMAAIICSDKECRSNSYDYITSCTPDDILFLSNTPDNISEYNMSVYGIDDTGQEILAYYKNLISDTSRLILGKQLAGKDINNSNWPGLDEYITEFGDSVLYPSRILINMELIQEILLGNEDAKTKKRVGGMTVGGSSGFTLKSFLSVISSYINYASGGAISLKLVSDPKDPDLLYFKDTKYLRDESGNVRETVVPYSVPMMANHPFGTIVKDFKLQATLPENAKNLSYVLNQDPSKISEYDIAPYMNFMYNAKNADAVNAMITEYSTRHKKAIEELKKAKKLLGLTPKLQEKQSALYKQLNTYLMFPTDDIRKSQQITAPIFPFTAEFTIDGISGFKYGDVVTFEALPKKYRMNTVFSIISITHNVGSDGAWYTAIRCIMRPNIA
jgi:hypothetical protein